MALVSRGKNNFLPAPHTIRWSVHRGVLISTIKTVLKENSYETMVFKFDHETGYISSWLDLDSEKYFTEEEAIKGHFRMRKKWSKGYKKAGP